MMPMKVKGTRMMCCCHRRRHRHRQRTTVVRTTRQYVLAEANLLDCVQ